MLALEVTNLNLHVGSFTVDVQTLDIQEGEYFVLMGGTGSGKSLLLKSICGLARINSGQIQLHNRDITNVAARYRHIGYVPQEGGLFPHLNVLQNITFPLTVSGIRPQQAQTRVEAIISNLNLEPLLTRSVAYLSGGERQRALVARALSQQPVCLLMDEPTAFLDLRHQLDLFALTQRLVKQDNLGALVISHDINLAAQFCDELLLMDKGQVAVQGGPEEVIRPEHLQPVYGCKLLVDQGPVSGKPRVTPIPPDDGTETF